MASSLKCASRRGLTERFDGSIGAASVLMPFGGSTQRTPAQSMAALLPVLPGQSTDLCSVMAWGFDPDTMVRDPFTGAAASVVDSMASWWPPAVTAARPTSLSRSILRSFGTSPCAGASPSLPCWGPWTPSWGWCGCHRRQGFHVWLLPVCRCPHADLLRPRPQQAG